MPAAATVAAVVSAIAAPALAGAGVAPAVAPAATATVPGDAAAPGAVVAVAPVPAVVADAAPFASKVVAAPAAAVAVTARAAAALSVAASAPAAALALTASSSYFPSAPLSWAPETAVFSSFLPQLNAGLFPLPRSSPLELHRPFLFVASFVLKLAVFSFSPPTEAVAAAAEVLVRPGGCLFSRLGSFKSSSCCPASVFFVFFPLHVIRFILLLLSSPNKTVAALPLYCC